MAFIIRFIFVNDKTENDLGKDKNEILYILFKCNFECRRIGLKTRYGENKISLTLARFI